MSFLGGVGEEGQSRLGGVLFKELQVAWSEGAMGLRRNEQQYSVHPHVCFLLLSRKGPGPLVPPFCSVSCFKGQGLEIFEGVI